MLKAAFAVGLVFLFATTALADVIAIDNQTIEFSPDPADKNRTVVKHNGVDRGVAREVKNADLIVTLPDGKRATQWQLRNVVIVYKVNPTCATHWNGQTWVQYCW